MSQSMPPQILKLPAHKGKEQSWTHHLKQKNWLVSFAAGRLKCQDANSKSEIYKMQRLSYGNCRSMLAYDGTMECFFADLRLGAFGAATISIPDFPLQAHYGACIQTTRQQQRREFHVVMDYACSHGGPIV